MNDTLRMLGTRVSTRAYSSEPITAQHRDAIIEAALRAPTAGNLVLYTIIEITDQTIKDRLVVTCDDQPFIATAPLVLLFVADMQKWTDLFASTDASQLPDLAHRETLGVGDLMLAAGDAFIAAQNAVVAAESLGIGSCYIGDIMENGEEHAALFDLPAHTIPVTMVCFGHPAAPRPPTPRYRGALVHENRYRRASAPELAAASAELEATFAPHGLPPGFSAYPQVVYARKFTSAYMAEMNRSMEWWLARWRA